MTLQEAADKHATERSYKALSIKEAAINDFIAGAEYFKNVLIERIVDLREKAPTMRDILYLDGVIVVIESQYTNSLSPESQPEQNK